MAWVKAASLDALNANPVVFNHPPRQISLFKVDDRVYAIDNRCPHEGYPLAVGSVEDAVVTCNWHNWKFRLRDGECLLGGDHVRSYPTRLEDGHAWVDLADPPPEKVRREVLRGLETAFGERDFGRICREITRLHYHGLEPKDAVVEALRWSHDRFEFGTRHSVAAAADWVALTDEFSELESKLICMAEAVDHLAFDSLREPRYAYPEAGEPFDHTEFLSAIEAEQSSRAEALVVRGLGDGMHWNDMEEAFTAAALAHYNSFGHSLIYVAKSGQLIESLGSGVESYLLLPLARQLAYATREDLVPEFKAYGPTLGNLSELDSEPHRKAELDVPFAATTTEALDWLVGNIASSSAERLYNTSLEALALNLLHFDTSYGFAYDRPVSQNVSWLAFTHGVTFANAARVLCKKYPRYWPQALAQMACFIGRNSAFIDREVQIRDWQVEDPAVFSAEVHHKLLDHGLRDPIFSAHVLKTSVAVQGELRYASASCREALLAGLNRFLNSPLKTKHVRRLARQAIELVARDFE